MSIGIPMLKIRRSRPCLIFNMGIPIPGKMVFILRQGPASGTQVHKCVCKYWKVPCSIWARGLYYQSNVMLWQALWSKAVQLSNESSGVICLKVFKRIISTFWNRHVGIKYSFLDQPHCDIQMISNIDIFRSGGSNILFLSRKTFNLWNAIICWFNYPGCLGHH